MKRATFSTSWLFSPSVQPLCLSTREAMRRTPSRLVTGRRRKSGEAEEMMSLGCIFSKYQGLMSP